MVYSLGTRKSQGFEVINIPLCVIIYISCTTGLDIYFPSGETVAAGKTAASDVFCLL